jgi:hypothetical protein
MPKRSVLTQEESYQMVVSRQVRLVPSMLSGLPNGNNNDGPHNIKRAKNTQSPGARINFAYIHGIAFDASRAKHVPFSEKKARNSSAASR